MYALILMENNEIKIKVTTLKSPKSWTVHGTSIEYPKNNLLPEISAKIWGLIKWTEASKNQSGAKLRNDVTSSNVIKMANWGIFNSVNTVTTYLIVTDKGSF